MERNFYLSVLSAIKAANFAHTISHDTDTRTYYASGNGKRYKLRTSNHGLSYYWEEVS